MKPCTLCGAPLMVNQRRWHFICCEARGGTSPVCNPITTKGRPSRTVCAVCWNEEKK